MAALTELKVKFSPVTEEEQLSVLYSVKQEFHKGEPGGLIMAGDFIYTSGHEKIFQLKPREDDVWLVTFPKCGKFKPRKIEIKNLILQLLIPFIGTHWTAELLRLLMSDFDQQNSIRPLFPE